MCDTGNTIAKETKEGEEEVSLKATEVEQLEGEETRSECGLIDTKLEGSEEAHKKTSGKEMKIAWKKCTRENDSWKKRVKAEKETREMVHDGFKPTRVRGGEHAEKKKAREGGVVDDVKRKGYSKNSVARNCARGRCSRRGGHNKKATRGGDERMKCARTKCAAEAR
ncbi:hypothetical protein KI387_023978 [Taxus chinensis]|uniref:Uncharacterized protein n=1 Tax=Taxus chinensis TaxID=29808 RepID=A0AA38L8G2_TAXCH|nr:hypothetical protein KI387_023978 [Taxus chinensis]